MQLKEIRVVPAPIIHVRSLKRSGSRQRITTKLLAMAKQVKRSKQSINKFNSAKLYRPTPAETIIKRSQSAIDKHSQ